MAFIPIKPDELRLGMYIKLECSWWNHPFAKSKFKLTSPKEIKTIKGIRKLQLFYDPELSDLEEEPLAEETPTQPAETGPTKEELERKEEETRKEQVQACLDHAAELQKSAYLYQQVMAQSKIAIKRISDGHAAGIKSAEQVVSSLIHAISKTSTSMALIDVLTSAEVEDSFFAHALNVCIVSLLVGKEFEVEEDDLFALGLAGLLHDIGKYNFPTMLRTKRTGFTRQEQQEWLKHSELGKSALVRFPSIPEATIQAVTQHHERLDGSGFPFGLRCDDISFPAKIIMVADEYDHLCHQSDPSKSLTPAEALSYLYDHYVVDKLMSLSDTINEMMEGDAKGLEKTTAVQNGNCPINHTGELSEEVIAFMVRALGVYPPGSFVELTNGAVGLVTGINPIERTKPSVMICSPQIPRKEARVVDLTQVDDLAVVHSIRPQHVPKEIHDYIHQDRPS